MNATVVVLLVLGESEDGQRAWAYVALMQSKLEAFMAAQQGGVFRPNDFGTVIESGYGEPPAEVREQMESVYGFRHDIMTSIVDAAHGHQLAEQVIGRNRQPDLP